MLGFSLCLKAKEQDLGPLLVPCMAGTGKGMMWPVAFLDARPVEVSRRG